MGWEGKGWDSTVEGRSSTDNKNKRFDTDA